MNKKSVSRSYMKVDKVEEKLRKSEQRFRQLFNSMNEIFVTVEIIYDEKGQAFDFRYLEINPATEKLVNKSRDEMIGKRAKELFGVIEDYWIQALSRVDRTGEPSRFENYSAAFDKYWNANIFKVEGYPNIVAIILSDISVRKKAEEALRENEERGTFLLELTDALKPLSDPIEIQETASRLLGEHLKADRVGYFEIEGDDCVIRRDYAPSAPHLFGRFPVAAFGNWLISAYQTGRMVVMNNIAEEPLTPDERESYFGIQVQAQISMPLIKKGKFVAGLTVHNATPRVWTSQEKWLLAETAERTWAAVELNRAGEALRVSEENLKRAQSMANMGNWRLDLQKNELVWSDEIYRIFGEPKGTPQNYETFKGYVHPEDREYVDKKWKAGLAGDEYDIEHRIIADGMVKWVREKAFLEFGEKGELLAGFGITQDITKRKNAETELEKSRIKLDMALENANIGLWDWNVKTNEVILDERSERMIGIEAGSFGRTYKEFEKIVHEEDIDHIRKAIKNILENNAPFEIIFRTKPADAKPKYISSKALAIRDQTGNVTSLTGVNFDITDLKEGTERLISKLNEDLLRSNKELENFAYIASHDLQEPLRMVTCFTQLLAKQFNEKLDDNAKEYIGFAVDAAKQMYDLINGLLAYSRISRKEITFSEVDMNKIIDSVKANLGLIIKEKNCLIETNNLPVVFAESNQMIQLFQNLITNGIKFSKNDPHIYISSKTEKTHFHFSVKDEGIGIDTKYFDKIFEIFKRLMPKDQYDGTGIGLAICKRIVENHSGKIWVESEPGKGSVFHFTLSKR